MGPGSTPKAEPRLERGFPRLRPRDRRVLRGWLAAVRDIGIERVEDLGSRPWSSPRPEFIMGVFRTGEPFAAWLVIGDDGVWAVGCCDSGAVSGRYGSLASALAALRPR
jgi:hypothetical protein